MVGPAACALMGCCRVHGYSLSLDNKGSNKVHRLKWRNTRTHLKEGNGRKLRRGPGTWQEIPQAAIVNTVIDIIILTTVAKITMVNSKDGAQWHGLVAKVLTLKAPKISYGRQF